MQTEELLEEASCNTEASVGDIEDLSAAAPASRNAGGRPVVNVSSKRKNLAVSDEDFSQSWRTALGAPPSMGHSRVSLLALGAPPSVAHSRVSLLALGAPP